MQPPAPLVPGAPPVLLRPVEHPELSPILTHFCGRGRPDGPHVPQDIQFMNAHTRLTSILWQQTLRTFVTFSGGDPATCFTEAKLEGLQFMIQRRGYQPWGLLFQRQHVYDAGGGPAWHARQEQFKALKQDAHLRSWAVRLQAGSSEWLEEREWRIVRHSDVSLLELRPAGLIVGDPSWTGAQWVHFPGQPTPGYYFPPLAGGLLGCTGTPPSRNSSGWTRCFQLTPTPDKSSPSCGQGEPRIGIGQRASSAMTRLSTRESSQLWRASSAAPGR